MLEFGNSCPFELEIKMKAVDTFFLIFVESEFYVEERVKQVQDLIKKKKQTDFMNKLLFGRGVFVFFFLFPSKVFTCSFFKEFVPQIVDI